MRSENGARRGIAVTALLLLVASAATAVEPTATAVLRLAEAQAAALASQPELEAAATEQRALDGALRQAALRPNPELGLEVEDVAGSGDYRGVEQAQTTLRILQPVEIGGDRAARTAVAARKRDLAGLAAAALRLDVLAATTNAFVEVLIAQEEVQHAAELVELAGSERRAAAERVRAGAALGVEETRARVAESEALGHESRGRVNLDAARRSLAALWGDAALGFDTVHGNLHGTSEATPLEALLARVAENPDVARFDLERQERDATLALARARRIPDPRVGGGARYLAGSGDAALVFEVFVPLPLFDRQQGAIAEATERVAKLGSERAVAERRVRLGLVAEHGRSAAAQAEVAVIRDRILPDSKRAQGELRNAYRSGRATQLEVLGAQRAEFEHVDRMLHLLGEYHHARVACERLVGGSVDELR